MIKSTTYSVCYWGGNGLNNPIGRFLIYLLPLILNLGINFYISNWNASNNIIAQFLSIKLFEVNIILLCIILWVIYSLARDLYNWIQSENNKKTQLLLEPLNRDIERLNEDIREKNRQLSDKVGSLIEKYSDLQLYRDSEALQFHLKKFTINNAIVHSSQLYRYTRKNYTDKTTVKVDYVAGFAAEAVDINALIQIYYEIPNDVYNEISHILELQRQIDEIAEEKSNFETLRTKHDLEQQLFGQLQTKCLEFLLKQKQIIDKKEVDELKEEDSFRLAFCEICVSIALNGTDFEAWEYSAFTQEKVTTLRRLKRTGILSGICRINEYVFKNKGMSSKKGRIYVTRCFELNGENYILMLSILSTVTDLPDWENLVTGLATEFVGNLQSELSIVYNDK